MRRSVLLSLALTLAACNSQVGLVKLIPVASKSTAAVMNTSASATATGNTITRVRVLLNEAEFNTSPADAGGAGPGHGGKCAGMGGSGGGGGGHAPGGDADKTQQGPFVLTFSADEIAAGTSAPVVLSDVPAGTYQSTELEIAPYGSDPDGRTMPTTAEFDDFRTSGNTVIVDGTWAGEAYTYAAKVEAEQERVGTVTVSSGETASLNFVLDTSTWFKASDGSDLDPRVAANHDAIAANIKASLTIDSGN